MKILYLSSEIKESVANILNTFPKEYTIYALVQNQPTIPGEVKFNDNIKVMSKNSIFEYNQEEIENWIGRQNELNVVIGTSPELIGLVLGISNTFGAKRFIYIKSVPMLEIDALDLSTKKVWYNYISQLNNFDGIFVGSKITEQNLRDLMYDDSKFECKILYYPIEIPKFKQEYSHSPSNKFITVCPLHWKKGLSWIMNVLMELKKEKDFEYTIVGPNQTEIEYLIGLANEYGVNLNYRGTVNKELKWKLIAESSAFIYPQIDKFQGGLSPLEALWIRTPVICNDTPYHRELYKDFVFYYSSFKEAKNLLLKSEGELLKEMSETKLEGLDKYIKSNFIAEVFVFNLLEEFKK